MLIELLNNDTVTASELSSKMEVSPRTIYRYIDILSSSHIPVYCQKGRNGGIKIGDEFKLSANFFNKDELQLITTAMNALQPQNEKTSSIIKKLCAIKKDNKSTQGYYNEDFVVDNANAISINPVLTKKVDALLNAKKERREVKICYHNRNGEIKDRVIQPYMFVYSNNNWYVYAHCKLDKDLRLFKISRITHIITLDNIYEIPNFEKNWNLSDPTQKDMIKITLQVSEKARYDVEEWFGIENVVKSQEGDYYIAQSNVYDNESTIKKLVGFSDGIIVKSPKSIANKVAEEHKRAYETYMQSTAK